jgi:hypothetical protein
MRIHKWLQGAGFVVVLVLDKLLILRTSTTTRTKCDRLDRLAVP